MWAEFCDKFWPTRPPAQALAEAPEGVGPNLDVIPVRIHLVFVMALWIVIGSGGGHQLLIMFEVALRCFHRCACK